MLKNRQKTIIEPENRQKKIKNVKKKITNAPKFQNDKELAEKIQNTEI